MFEQLCNGGWGWTWSNCLVKLNRYFLVFLKQIFILWGSLSLPTNHLMVCVCVCMCVCVCACVS
jgi:hypothetical protein